MPFLGTTGGGSVKQYGGQANLGYFIKNSLRTRSSASAYLNRTPASATNRQIWTYSTWLKRSDLTTGDQTIIAARADDNNRLFYSFGTGGAIDLYHNVSGTAYQVSTTALFRDPSAWYHFVIAVDTTQATAANRIKLYVNSVQQTLSVTTNGFPPQNTSTQWNNAVVHTIAKKDTSGVYSDCYLAETYNIDGQQLTPSSFGKTDAVTGQWIPKKFAGTYGTNGFYLKYADASAATAAAIGKDSSGNGNNWTPNNISVTAGVTYDAMIDSPSLSGAASNYCVFNPLDTGSSNMVASNGNLTFTKSGANFAPIRGTIAVTANKYYFEMLANGNLTQIGVSNGYNIKQNGGDNSISSSGGIGAAWDSRGYLYRTGSGPAYGYTFTTGDVVMVAFDATTGKIWFGKNGTWNTGDPATDTSPAYTASGYDFLTPFGNGEGGGSGSANFGQRPFSYTPPSGFVALNTYNL